MNLCTNFFSLLFLLLATTFLRGQNPNGWDTAWVNSYGGVGIEMGKDVKETSDKGLIILGTTSTYGNANTSFYVVKTDEKGGYVWSKTFGEGNNNMAYSLELANDGGYFFSGVSNRNIKNGYDGYLVKTDKDGNIQWTKNYGTEEWDFIYNSCLMPDGGLVLCGETFSKTKGGSDFYLIRTDLNGDTIWTKKLGATGNDVFYAVEQKNNRIYAVGQSFDPGKSISRACIYKFDLNGNKLMDSLFIDKIYENSVYNDLSLTSSGSVLLSGKRYTDTNRHCILIKFDTTSFTKLSYITTNQTLQFNSVTEGANNDIYVLGQTTGGLGGTSAVYYRFNSSFGFVSVANFGGAADEDGIEMIQTTSGYAFIGSTKSYGNKNKSIEDNVYLVVFNRLNLTNDYFLIVNEFEDKLSPVSLSENLNSENSIHSLFPNPVSDRFYVEFPNHNYEGQQIEFNVYNLFGELVYQEFCTVNNKKMVLSTEQKLSGVYTYRLANSTEIIGKGKLFAR